jgi:hypothetical protein
MRVPTRLGGGTGQPRATAQVLLGSNGSGLPHRALFLPLSASPALAPDPPPLRGLLLLVVPYTWRSCGGPYHLHTVSSVKYSGHGQARCELSPRKDWTDGSGRVWLRWSFLSDRYTSLPFRHRSILSLQEIMMKFS